MKKTNPKRLILTLFILSFSLSLFAQKDDKAPQKSEDSKTDTKTTEPITLFVTGGKYSILPPHPDAITDLAMINNRKKEIESDIFIQEEGEVALAPRFPSDKPSKNQSDIIVNLNKSPE